MSGHSYQHTALFIIIEFSRSAVCCTCSVIHYATGEKNNEGRTAENAGDAVSKSLIPIHSRTNDAMSELAQLHVPLLPPLVLAAYIACVAGAGALANCSLLAVLLKSSKNGLFSIIIQLAIANTALAASIGPEVWSYNIGTWYFGSNGCLIYRGLNIFASTASSYLVATIALHTLATVNLEEKSITRRNRRNDQDEDEEMRSSRHSLVACSDSSTPPRTMNVDYRLADTRVPVTQPSAFVWVLSLSLSVPEIALATTVYVDQDAVSCTIVDSGQRLQTYSMLVLFNLFLPTVIMGFAGALVIIKLKSKKILSHIDNSGSVAALKLSLWLIVVNFVLYAPRSVMSAYNTYTASIRDNESPIEPNYTVTLISLALRSVYLAYTLICPLLCIILLPGVRNAFSFGSVNSDRENV